MMIKLTTTFNKEGLSDVEFPKGKCIMDRIDDLHIEECKSSTNTFDADLSQATKVSNSQDWDSNSMYQVNNYVNYYSNDNVEIFDYLCFDTQCIR